MNAACLLKEETRKKLLTIYQTQNFEHGAIFENGKEYCLFGYGFMLEGIPCEYGVPPTHMLQRILRGIASEEHPLLTPVESWHEDRLGEDIHNFIISTSTHTEDIITYLETACD